MLCLKREVRNRSGKKAVYKMTKNENIFHDLPGRTGSRKKVIHSRKCRKCEKMELYTELCTLSTKSDVEKSVDSFVKSEHLFCEAFIKLDAFQNRLKNLLTFES